MRFKTYLEPWQVRKATSDRRGFRGSVDQLASYEANIMSFYVVCRARHRANINISWPTQYRVEECVGR
jgi:hypothetical protein